jgi:uncharacterized protein
MIISKLEFQCLKAMRPGEICKLTVDCGRREIEVSCQENIVCFEGGLELSLAEKIKDNFLYLLDEQGFRKITFFSEKTRRFYKLLPTSDWPTIAISSVPMHRRRSPCQDTLKKIEALKPYGRVLDTCMGLGYTAIESSKKADKVITFEKDEMIYEIDKINPYSRELFTSPKIEIHLADISLTINGFSQGCFDSIVHDPPTFTMAPELFSLDFYSQLWRVLKIGGKLFHYTPLYKVKQGFDFPSRVKQNLKKIGFKEARFSDKAQGIVCLK